MKTFYEILQEGTWELKPKFAPEAIKKIQDLKDWLYGKFGDDQVFDNLDECIKLIKNMSYNDHSPHRKVKPEDELTEWPADWELPLK